MCGAPNSRVREKREASCVMSEIAALCPLMWCLWAAMQDVTIQTLAQAGILGESRFHEVPRFFLRWHLPVCLGISAAFRSIRA